MRILLSFVLILSNCVLVLGQETAGSRWLQTNSKLHLYYVDLDSEVATVYEMGGYMDVAGRGYSIRKTDTLTMHHDGSYQGWRTKITSRNNKLYLVTALKKTTEFLLEPVKSNMVTQENLNNAYYLDHYFKMSRELNRAYPLYDHHFRDAFHTWKQLSNKDIDHFRFREFTDKTLSELKDSISQVQDRYVALTNYLVQNLKTLDYNSLKDSLSELPAQYRYQSWYYGTVIDEVAKQRPEYFFRLAEDFPANRSLIFSAVKDNKDVAAELKAVEGHDKIKKEFFKDKRFIKTMPYRIVGGYAMVAGLVTLLIVSQ